MIILAIFLPPVAVFLATHNPIRTVVSCLLTLCFWVPGSIHAVLCVNEAKTGKMLRKQTREIQRSMQR